MGAIWEYLIPDNYQLTKEICRFPYPYYGNHCQQSHATMGQDRQFQHNSFDNSGNITLEITRSLAPFT